MSGKNSDFALGQKDKHNIEYSYTDHGDSIDVEANTVRTTVDDPVETSYGSFRYDPQAKRHLIIPGTLDLHPAHAAKGVGREMARIADFAADKPIK